MDEQNAFNLPPEQNKKFKSKGKKVAIGIIIFSVFLLGTCSLIGYLSKKNKNDKNTKTKIEQKIENKTDFEKGLDNYNNSEYFTAKNYFSSVDKNDSNYTEAKKYIDLCDKEIKDQEKKEQLKKRNKENLEKKYNKIFDTSGWLHEKQNKLLKLKFTQYKSGYEDAPDGSKQIAMYFKKYEDGFYVHVMLQYAYALDYHYVKVWVEE